MEPMTLDYAIGVLVSASEARKQQWAGVGEGKRPDELIDELWESASTGDLEAQELAELIEDAIEVVNKARPVNG